MTLSGMNVLIVEDDPDLRRILESGLEEEGFDVTATRNGRDALARARAKPPQLLVVDIGLPDSDGRDVCQALRAEGIRAPVLFLTALGGVVDRLSGFNAGGDDYVTKPFEFAELVARLRALARRGELSDPTEAGDLRLDPLSHAVHVKDKRVALTPTEFRLLGALAEHPGEAVRRRRLVSAAWPDGAVVHDNTLDVYIARLRRKLRNLPTETAIHTAHRVGYRLE
jgi:two-component system OmpR family response regulator